MEELNSITINPVDPTTFEYQEYLDRDINLISSSRLDTTFTPTTDYIEYYVYDNSEQLIFPNPNSTLEIYDQRDYNVLNGDVILSPDGNLEDLGFDEGTFYSTYNFYRKQLESDQFIRYYICEISSDRTEIRLKSATIPNDLLISSSNSFIRYRDEADYFVDFLLNFGGDQQVIANNLKLDTVTEVDPSLLVKLYEPLPANFNLKDTLWVVEEISSPQAYSVTFPPIIFAPNDSQIIKGPNYSISITQQTGESSQLFNYDTLLSSNVTSSSDQLKNLLSRKEISINVDYKNYNNFIKFSSAQTRLENFYYKVGLIQSTTGQIDSLPLNDAFYSASKAELSTNIEKIITSFDGYEYFLYYDSGSASSYPKSTTTPPYILMPSDSVIVKTWLGSADPENSFYGGQALIASEYDNNNQDYLYNTIPEYLRSDPNNEKYELFVDMVAQQYDNTWLYTKNITTRFDADNRLDYGISKDLVADAIRDFGVKLYSNNFNTNDLYTAFLGLTPSGSDFPFPYMTGSIDGEVNTPTGYEYIDTQISASNNIVPLDDVNKRLYKRIYHNIPLLLKKKGTIAGIRALITAYGIPSTILRINEFGGKDRNDFQDWDYSQDVFNYAFYSDGVNSTMTSSFELNNGFTQTRPKTLQFRFKTPGIPEDSNPIRQNLWVGDSNTSFITLDYNELGMTTSSYSGSTTSVLNAYGTLTFFPDGNNGLNKTASIDLPFFDGGWWSVMATIDYTNHEIPAYLYSANRIGDQIGHSAVSNVTHNWQYFNLINTSSFPYPHNMSVNGDEITPFVGSYQEIRYWNTPLSESLFYDYVVNPYSTQGNTINITPNDLAFRADLGTQLITSSRKSIHPKVTGSWEITESFASGDSMFYVSGSFVENKETIFLNQVPGGIKNRINDQIRIAQEATPSGSTLSPYRSIQQDSYPNGSNPSINYLEVAFSPTDQVNDDIIAQIGAFNLGDYIGDPRQITESGTSYPALDALRDEYFTKYISSYNINDFIRLISFFDNSLFKMIEDFTPARTTLSSGVVVKQNLLERNRQAPPIVSYTTPEYSGSVKSFPRNYQVPDSDTSFPSYGNTSGSAIYKFSGGTGGTFEPFNNLFSAPASTSGLTETEISSSKFFAQYPEFVQQWSESITPSLGITPPYNQAHPELNQQPPINYPRIDQREFYNGEFGNSIQVKANEICKAFFGQDSIIDYFFRIAWFNNNNKQEQEFLSSDFLPSPGNVWFWADTVNQDGELTQNYPLNITQNFQTSSYGANSTFFTNASTTSGNGSGASFSITTTTDPAALSWLKVVSTNPGSGYKKNDIVTISQSTLIGLGFQSATQDLIITLLTQDVANKVTNKVSYIKMSNVDDNGVKILPFIIDSNYAIFKLTSASDWRNVIIEGFQTYYISNTLQQSGSTLIVTSELEGSEAVNSFDTSFYDLTFSASGVFSYSATSSGEDPNVIPSSGITESISQGYFPPIPSFPTESFFRGWSQADYFQTSATGDVYRVSSGSGFNTDTFGNFNTGSTEFDGDDTNTVSNIPWFMNAKASTYHALSASSTITNSQRIDKLYLYEGDITASSVPIGPAYNIYTPPPPVTIDIQIEMVTPVSPILTTTCVSGWSMPPDNSNLDASMNINVNGDPNIQYYMVFKNLNDVIISQPSWITIVGDGSPLMIPGSNNLYSGNRTLTLRASPGGNVVVDGPTEVRSVKSVIVNNDDLNNQSSCTLTQEIYTEGSSQGGGL
jgi:hypothetical protein